MGILTLTAALLSALPSSAEEPRQTRRSPGADTSARETNADDGRPNVLFIAIDDLNDWLGCLKGHPQVKTPHIDALARRGVLFTNAHCAAPLCSPSRAATFSGRHPFQTGVFGNDDDIRKVEPNAILLPEYFARHGYRTLGTGKLLHNGSKGIVQDGYFPHQRWSPFDPKDVLYTPDELPTKGTNNPRHLIRFGADQQEIVLPFNRMPSDRRPNAPAGESFDWGPVDVPDSAMGDGQITDWAIERLRESGGSPFFLAVGFYRPHIPLYAPRRYFELYDDLDVLLPPVREDDLDDLSSTGKEWALEAVTAGAHATVVEYGQWQAAVKGYLACISFVDSQVGRIIQALDEHPGASNTVVVLWSDHGWHLGEKQHWGKWTGWQRSTHVPLIVLPPRDSPPAGFHSGSACAEPVSLLDLYPTLIELCRLPPRGDLAGTSLVPLLSNPNQDTGRMVVTTFDDGNYSLTGRRWHYIRYRDGSEELYDSQADPHEWKNLADERTFRPQLEVMSRELDRQLN